MTDTSIVEEYLPVWLEHVKTLAVDIGPRGSTTEKEKEASDYCQQIFRNLHLSPHMETFLSAKSIYQPHLLASLLMLLAFVLYPLSGRLSAGLAALISVIAFVSQLLELSFRDNIFRRIVPKGNSQNVYTALPPEQEHKQDLILIGHVDSHRTPLIFRSANWVRLYQVYTSAAFVLGTAQVLLYILGTFTMWSWIWPVTAFSAISAAILAAICIQADSSPFSAGANDNATSVGLILTLAQHFQDEPLQYTRVWLVCTGCEEVQHYGAIDFFRRHRSEMKSPIAVVFETMGCSGPSWITKEGIIIPFRSDSKLVKLAEELAEAHPHLGAYPTHINGGNTEMADALRAGIPAIALHGMRPTGELPYWHQVEDTFDKMDQEVMARAYEFAWEYIAAVDSMQAQIGAT